MKIKLEYNHDTILMHVDVKGNYYFEGNRNKKYWKFFKEGNRNCNRSAFFILHKNLTRMLINAYNIYIYVNEKNINY